MQNKPESVRSNVEESIENLFVCCAHLPVLVMMVGLSLGTVSFSLFTFQLVVMLTPLFFPLPAQIHSTVRAQLITAIQQERIPPGLEESLGLPDTAYYALLDCSV